MVTRTQEDYLRAIYRLTEELGREIKIKDLVQYMDLAKSTVSERVTSLAKRNLVQKTNYSPIVLTARGLKIGAKLTLKHRIIEVFLHEFLGLDLDSVHEEAHRLEHAFSDRVIEQLRKKLENPLHCPHGRPFPNIELATA
ncbi:MAG: metal-dependent transcriptional regulator [Candidatus Heimdallarchaeota archaeon]